MRLKDKAAVVTGGGNGIGRAICLAFADEGAAVAVSDIDAQAAKRMADEIVRQGGRAISLKMDVTNTGDVHQGVERTVQELGKIHIWLTTPVLKATGPISGSQTITNGGERSRCLFLVITTAPKRFFPRSWSRNGDES